MEPVRANVGIDLGAVGIDLGTSNTVVAHVDDGVARALACDVSKEILIPSVCTFHPSGAVIVGRDAKERRLQDPKNTIFSAKRLIGRPWGSKEVAQARARLPYELKEGKNASVLVVSRQKEYTLPEISAFVLRKAKAIADVALNRPVTRAVITCPANFDELQRAATKLAGTLAGFEVLRVLNEPTAAALAYGYGKEGEERILVYDFGGGTFDVTLLERKGEIFQVRATAGDSYLGGDDIDAAIANRIAEGFAAKHFYDPRADRQVFEHVRDAAEKLKAKLSKEDRSTIELVDVAFGPGGKSLGFEFSLTQRELAEIADPFIDKTFKVCRKVLAPGQIAMRDIDQVLLVGGSTLIARVRERAAEFFAREPATGVSPFEAVAVGAAIQAYAMTDALEDEAGSPTQAALKASRTVSVPPPAPPARPAIVSTERGAEADCPPPPEPAVDLAPPRHRFVIEPPVSRVKPRYSARLLTTALLLLLLLVSWLVRR
jgi:molecular chaperone DnaK